MTLYLPFLQMTFFLEPDSGWYDTQILLGKGQEMMPQLAGLLYMRLKNHNIQLFNKTKRHCTALSFKYHPFWGLSCNYGAYETLQEWVSSQCCIKHMAKMDVPLEPTHVLWLVHPWKIIRLSDDVLIPIPIPIFCIIHFNVVPPFGVTVF